MLGARGSGQERAGLGRQVALLAPVTAREAQDRVTRPGVTVGGQPLGLRRAAG